VDWYRQCWEQFNNKAWDQFQNCYGENASSESIGSEPTPVVTGRQAIVARDQAGVTAFPDRRGEPRLILINSNRIATVAMYAATNTGEMPGPDGKPMPATNKPIGLLIGHVVELDPVGAFVVSERAYVDDGTVMAQLGLSPAPARPAEKLTGAQPTIVMAANDEKERANLAAATTMLDLVNRHDVDALAKMTPDDYKLMEIARPTDADKKAAIEGMKELFSGFPDVKMTSFAMWAAGDYVVIEGMFEGTNTGDLPSMGVKKTGRKVTTKFFEVIRFDNGQPKEDWLFFNGAAFASQLGLK
jgi:predicted ester cyclase